MKFASIAHQVEKFVQDNSPAILTAIGVTGTITTAYLTGKASFKSADEIASETERVWMETKDVDDPTFLTSMDKVKLVWKNYIPPVSTGLGTVAAIVFANRISTRRAAAMAAAYSLSERAFGDYKEKITEKLGIKKEEAARVEISQDRVNENPLSTSKIIFTGNGDVICFDQPAGRYFKSNYEKIRSVVNDVNEQALNTGHTTLSDFYIALNLPPTPWAEELGWTRDDLLEVQYSTVLTDDHQPCVSIDYQPHPIREYNH